MEQGWWPRGITATGEAHGSLTAHLPLGKKTQLHPSVPINTRSVVRIGNYWCSHHSNGRRQHSAPVTVTKPVTDEKCCCRDGRLHLGCEYVRCSEEAVGQKEVETEGKTREESLCQTLCSQAQPWLSQEPCVTRTGPRLRDPLTRCPVNRFRG